MSKKWFKEYGWVYAPTSLQGIILIVLTLIFNFQVFMAIDRKVHSVSDLLYGIFPYLVGSLTTLFWIASKTSSAKK